LGCESETSHEKRSTKKNTIRPKRQEGLEKLMIEKELITQAEFMNKLVAEETGYRELFKRMK